MSSKSKLILLVFVPLFLIISVLVYYFSIQVRQSVTNHQSNKRLEEAFKKDPTLGIFEIYEIQPKTFVLTLKAVLENVYERDGIAFLDLSLFQGDEKVIFSVNLDKTDSFIRERKVLIPEIKGESAPNGIDGFYEEYTNRSVGELVSEYENYIGQKIILDLLTDFQPSYENCDADCLRRTNYLESFLEENLKFDQARKSGNLTSVSGEVFGSVFQISRDDYDF